MRQINKNGSVMRSLPSLRSAISNPHRRNPDDLAVLLFAPDVVIARLARFRLLIAPGEFHCLLLRLEGVDVPVISDDVDSGERRRADELYFDGWRRRGLERIPHHITDSARVSPHLCEDVVSRAIDRSEEHTSELQSLRHL